MDENTLSNHQFQLFEPPSQTAPERNYDPESWSSQPDVSHHASNAPTMPQEFGSSSDPGAAGEHTPGYGQGFHTGTYAAAEHRARSSDRTHIHPVRHEGSMALRPESMGAPWALTSGQLGGESGDDRDPRQVWSDLATNDTSASSLAEGHVSTGMTIPYLNEMEDQGSISYRSPRQNLRSWSEDVTADPGASHHDKLVAEQYDLTVPWQEQLQNPITNGPRHTEQSLMMYTPEGKRLYDKTTMDQTGGKTGPEFRKKKP